MFAKKRYDTKMIRDFLDQLRLELQLSLEYAESDQADGPETLTADFQIARQLAELGGSYDAALLPTIEYDEAGAAEEDVQRVRRAVQQIARQERQQQLNHLDALADLFDEAIRGAGQRASQRVPTKTVNVKSFLETSAENPPAY